MPKAAVLSNSPPLTDEQRAQFDAKVEAYRDGAQKIVDENYKQYANLAGELLVVEQSPRYVRIWSDHQEFIDYKDRSKGRRTQMIGNRPHRRIHTFIDRTNGDILKPATYKAPAKHARGNLFDAKNGLGTVTSHGPGYLR